MIDWVTDKVIMSIIVLILIAAAVKYFDDRNDTLNTDTLDAVSQDIAKAVNDISMKDSQIRYNLSFHSELAGKHLPQTINDQPYEINIFRGFVLVEQDNDQSSADFISPVHLGNWRDNDNLKDGETDSVTLKNYDRAHYGLKITSGDDIVLERVLLVIDGVNEYHTFIYSEHAKPYTD